MTDCIFCRIVAGEIPATILKRTPDAVAFRDLNPQAPTHVLIIPTAHLGGMNAVTDDRAEAAVGKMMRLAAALAAELGVAASGYRLVANTGVDGGQSVDHLHLHLLAGRRLGWPPG